MDAATLLHAHCATSRGGDALHLPDWTLGDWQALLVHAEIVRVDRGDALVRLGEQERAVYFVIDGALEVAPSTGRGDTLGPVLRELPGSMFGEVSLFDGLPRSASVWAIQPTTLLRITHDGVQAFSRQQPVLANALLWAMGRVLAGRLRQGEARQRRSA